MCNASCRKSTRYFARLCFRTAAINRSGSSQLSHRSRPSGGRKSRPITGFGSCHSRSRFAQLSAADKSPQFPIDGRRPPPDCSGDARCKLERLAAPGSEGHVHRRIRAASRRGIGHAHDSAFGCGCLQVGHHQLRECSARLLAPTALIGKRFELPFGFERYCLLLVCSSSSSSNSLSACIDVRRPSKRHCLCDGMAYVFLSVTHTRPRAGRIIRRHRFGV